MEPECSLPHSQVPATCHYPKPARSSAYPTSHFLKIHLNIALPSSPGSPKLSLSLRFHHQKPDHASPFVPYMLYASPISFFLILSLAQTWVSSTDHKFPIMKIPPLPFTSSLLGPNILLNNLFLNTLSLRCSLSDSYQVSHLYIKNFLNYNAVYFNLQISG